MTETSAAVAARGVRSIRPSDLAAAQVLESSDPAVLADLTSRVVSACARIADSTAADVCALAVLTVARHYATTGDVQHAVASAVRMARQTVATAAVGGDVLFDPTDGDVRVRLETWTATRPDAIAQTNDQREAFRALLARTGDVTVEAWELIADAWLSHDSRVCVSCQRPGARPGALTLTTIRAHAQGLTRDDAAYHATRRADVRTCEAVTAALAPMVAARGAGPVLWDADRADLWEAFGVAWAMVVRGDDLHPVDHVSPMGEVNGRPLTEAEAALAARPTAKRERSAAYPGEGDDSATTAPNLRDVSASTGMLRAFKPVVSPRKRAAGQTGPTVPTTLAPAGAAAPLAHDADRADRYAARLLAGRRAVLVAQGADLPA